MASLLFDTTDIGDQLPISGLHSYHYIIKLASVVTGLTGVVFTVKGVYLTANVGALWKLPISNELKHVVNTCIALGILLSFTGITGITCPTYDGIRLYIILTILLFIIELAVTSSLFALMSKLEINWDYISHFCEACAEPFNELVNVIYPTIGIALCLALSQIIILYIIHRFLKLTAKEAENAYNDEIALPVCVMTPGSNSSRPCSSTPAQVTSHQLEFTLTSSPGKYLTPTIPRRLKQIPSSRKPFFPTKKFQKPSLDNRFTKNLSPLPIPEIVITPATPIIPFSSTIITTSITI